VKNLGKALVVILILVGCSESDVVDKTSLTPEKKYHLQECAVQVNFSWKPGLSILEKEKVLTAFDESMKKALVSGRFPLFGAHTTASGAYYMLYFSDVCEQRVEFVEKLMQEFLAREVENVPDYRIDKTPDVGADGVTPSGWWIDARAVMEAGQPGTD
jgi:hypothetical protein